MAGPLPPPAGIVSPVPRWTPGWIDFAGLCAVVFACYGSSIASRALWNPDEPRVAHIGWVMARSGGDWVVPRVNGIPFLQEPPLTHWLVAASFRAFGAAPGDDWVPRVPTLVFSCLTILLTGILGARLGGRRCGFLAAVTLATMAEFLEIGNRAGTDAGLVFWVTLAAFQLVDLGRGAPFTGGRALLLGASTGLSFLTKNLLGPVFIALILLAVLAGRPPDLRSDLRPDLICTRRAWAHWILCLGAFAVVALPWLLLLDVRDPGSGKSFLGTLLLENTGGRFSSSGRHDPGILEFLGRVLADWLPWTPLILAALWKAARMALRRDAVGAAPGDPAPSVSRIGDTAWVRAHRVLLAWIVLPSLVILFSSSKRDLYLLSIYPALAVVLAIFLDGVIGSRPARIVARVVLAVLGPALPAMAAFGGLWAGPLPMAIFAALGIHLFFLYRWARGRACRSSGATCCTVLILLGLGMGSANLLRYRILDPEESFVPLGRALDGLRSRGMRIAGFRLGLRELSAVGYYLGETLPVLEDEEEAARLLSAPDPPAALVAREDVLAKTSAAALQHPPGRLHFEVSRGVAVLTSVPLEEPPREKGPGAQGR